MPLSLFLDLLGDIQHNERFRVESGKGLLTTPLGATAEFVNQVDGRLIWPCWIMQGPQQLLYRMFKGKR